MTQEANKEAIKHAYDTIFKTFESLDFRAAANCITADCDYITFNGLHLQGREAYLQSHEEMMNNFMFRGSTQKSPHRVDEGLPVLFSSLFVFH